MKTNTIRTISLLAVLSGCSMDPVHLESDFGNSVHQMIAGQISDPNAAANPSLDAPDLLDGVGAEESLRGYRRDANRTENAQQEIRLSID